MQRERVTERSLWMTTTNIRPIEVHLHVNSFNRTMNDRIFSMHSSSNVIAHAWTSVTKQVLSFLPRPLPIRVVERVIDAWSVPTRAIAAHRFPNHTEERHHFVRLSSSFYSPIGNHRHKASFPQHKPLEDRTAPRVLPEESIVKATWIASREVHPHHVTHVNNENAYSFSRSVTMLLAANPQTAASDKPSDAAQAESRREAPPMVQNELPAAPPQAIDMKRLTDDVYQAIERKLRIERQRKGL
ncbi:hypothetical protein [Paenibacillus spongiae]|uniref:Uncharacterized protein n=1 Tax=Paenibacillus spongiae TaxID=2909671 RepID=A0ABY5S0K7_9BACL|nr:hypothetical protein [Paenibacillus spongiae]UVI27382.1 hypothetical protein L1F29_18075 [Paenibacillus spongiae]